MTSRDTGRSPDLTSMTSRDTGGSPDLTSMTSRDTAYFNTGEISRVRGEQPATVTLACIKGRHQRRSEGRRALMAASHAMLLGGPPSCLTAPQPALSYPRRKQQTHGCRFVTGSYNPAPPISQRHSRMPRAWA
ncbi:hypothetical protein ACOMHN_011843 [Nucella lapillus]